MKKLKDGTVKALERIANAFQRRDITPKTVISRVFFLAVLILALTRLAQILGVLTWILIAVLFIMFFKDLLPQPLTTFFNWVLTIAVVWIIASLVIIPFIPVFFKSAQGQRAWRWVKWSVPNFYYKLQFFVNKTLNPLTWSDEYYTSQVDDASKTLVGLQIRELKVLGVKHQSLGSFNAFYPDQDVYANAIVSIKSVKDFASPVTARFSCWIKKGKEKIMGVTDPESLTTNYWVGGVSCKIPSNALQDLKPGFYSLVFAADFNAYTWAYVNVQFMSEEKAKSLNYQFPTTFITAETTNSPVRIGVYPNDIEQPLIVYKNMADSGSTLTMLGASLNTMHNGELTKIHEMLLIIPKPFILKTDGCSQRVTLQNSDERFNIYKVESFKPGTVYQAVTCPLTLASGGYKALFSNTGLAEVTFRFKSSYDFRLEKTAGIEILKPLQS